MLILTVFEDEDKIFAAVQAGASGYLLKDAGAEAVVRAVGEIAAGGAPTSPLVARKLLENWLYWIVIDVVAAVLYGSQGLYATSALYLLYAGLAVRGFVAWRRDLQGLAPAHA